MVIESGNGRDLIADDREYEDSAKSVDVGVRVGEIGAERGL